MCLIKYCIKYNVIKLSLINNIILHIKKYNLIKNNNARITHIGS